jgi:hypothetical protein
MLVTTKRYPNRVNARLDDDDFKTLQNLTRSIIPFTRATYSDVLRFLLRDWQERHPHTEPLSSHELFHPRETFR